MLKRLQEFLCFSVEISRFTLDICRISFPSSEVWAKGHQRTDIRAFCPPHFHTVPRQAAEYAISFGFSAIMASFLVINKSSIDSSHGDADSKVYVRPPCAVKICMLAMSGHLRAHSAAYSCCRLHYCSVPFPALRISPLFGRNECLSQKGRRPFQFITGKAAQSSSHNRIIPFIATADS